ncbi:MAG: efflux RND transporter permease subunit [Phycisphaerae bacterium]|nr:efflux RND transporter permease subunit [Phycisphaerae bacterium]
MKGLIALGVRRPIVGSLLMWFFVIGGCACLLIMRREFFPETDPEAARIALIYPGASPQEIEESMARKIEDAIVDLDGIKRITSNLAEGGGGIVVEFEDSIDINKGIDDVRIAVDALEDLPEESERIRVTELLPNIPVIMVTMHGGAGEAALKAAARSVEEDLRGLPGMGSIVKVGMRGYEMSVEVDAVALQRHGLRLSDIADTVRSWMTELPAGTMRTSSANVGVRTMGVEERASAIREIPLQATTSGQVLRLGDIARVTDGFRDERVTRRFNGEPAASLIVFKKSDEDAVRIAEMVRGYVAGRRGDALERASGWSRVKGIVTGGDRERGYQLGLARRAVDPLPCEIVAHSDLARLIEGRLDLLTNDAWQGSLLVLIVMLLFMNGRSAWWIMSGIFVSIGCTVVLMWTFDITLNLITMFGLLIVVGMLADDAIVVSDIILQRSETGVSPEVAAVEGTSIVSWPIIANATTVVLAFLPLAFVSGRMGDLLGQLPIVAAVALASSVVETMLILPAHMAHAVRAGRRTRTHALARFWQRYERWREQRFMPRVIGTYTSIVTWCLRERYVTAGATLAVLLVSVGMVAGGRVPFIFLPTDDTETVIVDIRLPVGSTADATQAVVARFERAGNAQPDVRAISSVVGQSTNFETGIPDSIAEHVAQMYIELAPVESRSRHSAVVLDAIRDLVGEVDEAESVNYAEVAGGPSGADITYQVRGDDREAAKLAAEQLKVDLRNFAGVYSIGDDDVETQRELRVELKPAAAALGLNVADVARQVRGMLYGLEAHAYSALREDIKVRVRLDEAARERIDSVADLRITTADGRSVPLAEVARVTEGNAYAAVHRVDRARTITITADCSATTNPEEITRALAPALERIRAAHPTIDIREAGRQKDLNDAMASLPWAFIASIAAIYVVLACLFASYTQPFAVMLAIPFGLIGVVWGHWVMGYQLTFLSLIGFVALSGIVVNNSLILVEFTNLELLKGRSLREALVVAGSQRLRPIVLTTATTVCGLIPLLLERSFQAKFLIPMGISICGGLVSATALTLLLLPANILIVDDIRRAAYYLWHGRPCADALTPGEH